MGRRAIGCLPAMLAAWAWIGAQDAMAAIPPSGPQPLPNVRQLPLPAGNVLPGVPRVKSVGIASYAHNGAVVPFANVNVNIVIHNLAEPPGTAIPYRVVRPRIGSSWNPCTLTRNPRISVSDTAQVQPNGELGISLPGWFTSSGEQCAVALELVLPGKTEPVALTVPTPVSSPVNYTLGQTWSLRNTFAVRVNGTLGTCEGTSIGPTSYSVGIVEQSNDLAYRIRSGPIGTECQYTTKAWVLPDGVRLVSLNWERISEIPSGQDQGKCCVVNAYGHNCITMPPHVGQNFTKGTVPIVTGEHVEASSGYQYALTSADAQIVEDGVSIYDNSTPRVVTVIRPMWGKLQCTNTLVNDHGVKLVLRELVLSGPPGLTFP